MYPAFVGVAISWPEWNALRPRPIYLVCLLGIFPLQVSGAPGSTVVPSQGSTANLAGEFKTSGYSAVGAGLRMWESRMRFPSLAFLPGASAGQSL